MTVEFLVTAGLWGLGLGVTGTVLGFVIFLGGMMIAFRAPTLTVVLCAIGMIVMVIGGLAFFIGALSLMGALILYLLPYVVAALSASARR